VASSEPLTSRGFKAFKGVLVTKDEAGYQAALTHIDDAVLPEGDVTVQVEWSTLTYKDGLAILGQSPMVLRFRQAVLHGRGIHGACGLAGGMDFPTTVVPFTLRGITLYGIDSVMAPLSLRQQAWQRLASELDMAKLDAIAHEIGLSEVIEVAKDLLQGKVRGRLLVDVNRD
jgi:NADPH:quinone reductase-like Zn-dependent oxidoreductase